MPGLVQITHYSSRSALNFDRLAFLARISARCGHNLPLTNRCRSSMPSIPDLESAYADRMPMALAQAENVADAAATWAEHSSNITAAAAAAATSTSTLTMAESFESCQIRSAFNGCYSFSASLLFFRFFVAGFMWKITSLLVSSAKRKLPNRQQWKCVGVIN